MGRNTVTTQPARRQLNRDDAEAAVGDAIADLMHVYGGDRDKVARFISTEAFENAVRHYRAEAADPEAENAPEVVA